MKQIKRLIPLVLAVVMLFGSVSLAAGTQTPAPMQTMVPEKVDGTVAGTVIHVEDNDIVVNMDNGNTVMFMLNYLHVTDAAVGDKVSVDYSGDVLDAPEAVTITITEKAQPDQQLSGTVMAFDDTRVFVTISSKNVFGFTLDKDTTITGASKTLASGDEVTVTYTGALDSVPYAKDVNITKVAKTAANDAKLQNKTLDGSVRSLSSSKITIHTNSGKNYTFKIDGTTQVTGDYSLETGCRVRVTYDGYAAKSPLAKIIKVLSPSDPTPPSPSYHTTTGYVESFLGVFLSLDNGMIFDCSGASYGGNSDGEVADKAKVTYYTSDDGVNHATKVVFTAIDYDPVPAPDPEPDPDPDPVPDVYGLLAE